MESVPLEVLKLERYISSLDYIVPTNQIRAFADTVDEVINTCGDCGLIVYGPSRAGKTCAIKYTSRELKIRYGRNMPTYVFCATESKHSMKDFYSKILDALGHKEAFKGTTAQMRRRIINLIECEAEETILKRAVLFVDEAYEMSDSEYQWLMDIYNVLDYAGISLTVILVGTEELKAQKNGFIKAGKKQIVHRLMVHELEFKGLVSCKEMQICLYNIDANPINVPGLTPINLLEFFFPEASKDGKTLYEMGSTIYEAFEQIKRENSIAENDIIMKYLLAAIIRCFHDYGYYGQKKYLPNLNDWKESIVKSGYVGAMVAT